MQQEGQGRSLLKDSLCLVLSISVSARLVQEDGETRIFEFDAKNGN